MMVELSTIWFDRATRQRTKIDTAELKDSIAKVGLINPPVVVPEPGPQGQQFRLLAGERRLTAMQELGWTEVPVTLLGELDRPTQEVIELEENIKRSDLGWRDHCRAVCRIHQINQQINPKWSAADTARVLSVSPNLIGYNLRVFRDLDSPFLATCTSFTTAFNLLSKRDGRVHDTVLADLMDGGEEQDDIPGLGLPAPRVPEAPPDAAQANPGPGPEAPTPPPAPVAAPPSRPREVAPDVILQADFLQWVKTYSGPKFNLIHCDFPYGVNFSAGSQGAQGAASSADMGPGGMAAAQARLYDDSPEVYWALLQALLLERDRFMSSSAHLVFWFSMKHYTRTMEFFAQMAPEIKVNPFPLVWHKSDNKGILPDAKRGPRQIYETALVASRGDRYIVRPVSNSFSGVSDKQYHASTKPQDMLEYFLGMLVDDTTTLLDPTCGGGSALRAAEALGAKSVLGLELDPEHAASARHALRASRMLAKSITPSESMP